MFTPLVCKFGIGFLIALRVIIGIFSGLSFTSAYDVLTKWIPPAERSRSGKLYCSLNYETASL